MSEFGKGLTYCLGLFLCHSERDYIVKDEFAKTKEAKDALKIINRPDLWFYMAADHIFDMEIPISLPQKLKNRLMKFRSKVIGLRLPMNLKNLATEKDKIWAVQEAKDLLRLIDKHFGIDTKRGDFE